MTDGPNPNVKPIMGEEELEAALRLVQRIRLLANDGNFMYKNIEAAVLVHEHPRPYPPIPVPHGCICPAGAEKTCEGLACPRRNPFKEKDA